MLGSTKAAPALPGRAGRSLRLAALAGTSLAIFTLLGGLMAEPSFAGRALRVKPTPAAADQGRVDLCLEFGETSQQCLEALSKLAPSAGPRGYEVHEFESADDGSSSGGTTSGGETSSSGGETSSSGSPTVRFIQAK